ncbi:MAG: ribosome biogenesis GTP-binding protein YihA/YsxC [Panacagrimonas sp.]
MSAASLTQCPRDEQPEIAFAGRSNSGKSSALNTLCGRKALARVSKTPGRTQLINLFELPAGGRLADLPGYGYAAVPGATRKSWARMVGGYVEQRVNLRGIVLIMDCRHPLTDHDRDLLAWIKASQRQCHVLLTKADKLSYSASKKVLTEVRKGIADLGVDADLQLFSSMTDQGVEEARKAIWTLLNGAPLEAAAATLPESGTE